MSEEETFETKKSKFIYWVSWNRINKEIMLGSEVKDSGQPYVYNFGGLL